MAIKPDEFENPQRKYYSKTFWGWNGKLEDNELKEQIAFFNKMGLKGFYMHPRDGFDTVYLSDEYFERVKTCIDTAKKYGMEADIYDEDGYSSGFAGGYCTKNIGARARCLIFTAVKKKENELCKLLSRYDVTLDDKGYMTEYNLMKNEYDLKGKLYYAYLCIAEADGWHNGGALGDVLNAEVTKQFLDTTHEMYKKHFAGEFGKTVTSVFTDEPQHLRCKVQNTPFDNAESVFAWTTDFEKTFFDKYGYSIIQHIPQLVFECMDNSHLGIRYFYNAHISYRFRKGFFEPYSKWCEDNGLDFTGHMDEEQFLTSQMNIGGECMRYYPYMDIPGIDVIRNQVELSTALQCRSIVRQYGKKGMMSEMYGVTNWDFDFRGQKFCGDWQAALGVTHRVLHLSWYTMKGRAKRDCPPPLGYQLPWCNDYKIVENHYARLNSILSNSKPITNVAVIHPIETMWVYTGSNITNGEERRQTEENFNNTIQWLLEGSIDFDFICESLIPEQNVVAENGKLHVGCMCYGAVVVPQLMCMRESTIRILREFLRNGGQVVFIEDCPKCVDGIACDKAMDLYKNSIKIQASRIELLNVLENLRDVCVRNADYTLTDNLIYSLSEKWGDRWLFLAQSRKPESYDVPKKQQIVVDVTGEYNAELYDTVTGDIRSLPNVEKIFGHTVIKTEIDVSDSLLIRLTKNTVKECEVPFVSENSTVEMADNVDYELCEENVLLLDNAQYAFENNEYNKNDDILKISKLAKKHFGYLTEDYIKHGDENIDPWVLREQGILEHTVNLRFCIHSLIDVDTVYFASEEISSLRVNNEKIELKECGWFCDRSIKKYKIPSLRKGENIIDIQMPFSIIYGLEYCYLLGNFGVELCGSRKTITQLPEKIGFSSLHLQKLPFYGGSFRYSTNIKLDEISCIKVKIPSYTGGGVKVYIDDKVCGFIVFAPYELFIKDVQCGNHKLVLELLGNRYNTFGGVHNIGTSTWYLGDNYWAPDGDEWSYEYKLKNFGILSAPIVSVVKRKGV